VLVACWRGSLDKFGDLHQNKVKELKAVRIWTRVRDESRIKGVKEGDKRMRIGVVKKIRKMVINHWILGDILSTFV
jgi:hypothetical protein